MRIGINCKYLTVPFSGIGQYTVNFLEPLAKLDQQNEYYLFINEAVDFNFGKNFKVVVVPEGGISKKQSYLRRLYWEQFKLSRALKQNQIEIYHSLYQTLPTAARNIPSVVTVHDAIPWHFDFQRKDPRYRFYSDFSRWSCKRADKIVTISEYSRIDVTQVYHLKPETIEVIHEGISPRYFERPSDDFIRQVRKKFELPHSYILYVGGLKRHKNLRVLLKSFATMIEEKKIDTHLVLPGAIRKNMAVTSDIYYTVPSLEKYAFEHGVGDRVHFVGYVDFDELNALYHEA
ncbi:MAG: mannosyltransferase B-like protein, partial [uncultured bacterium]